MRNNPYIPYYILKIEFQNFILTRKCDQNTIRKPSIYFQTNLEICFDPTRKIKLQNKYPIILEQ